MKKPKLILALCLSAGMAFAQYNNVVNIAGTGALTSGNSSGLSEPQPNNHGSATGPFLALNDNIAGPTGLTLDGAGNLYYIDTGTYCVMKVDKYGVVSLVAGIPNVNDYTGNHDGTAGGTAFRVPEFLCLDAAGNLYITDVNNRTVSMVQANSNGATGLTPACAIYIVAGVPGNNTGSGDGGPAISSPLSSPGGIVVDKNGTLFIAEAQTNSVRAVNNVANVSNPSASLLTTLASGFSAMNLTLDPQNGDMYLRGTALNNCCQVRKITADASGNLPSSSATMSLYAGIASGVGHSYGGDGGPKANALFNFNTYGGIAVDVNHNVYIADEGNLRIREIFYSGVNAGTVNTIAGNGSFTAFNYAAPGISPTSANINPLGIAVDACGSLYFADVGSYVIGKISNPVTFAPTITPISAVCAGSNIVATGNTGGLPLGVTPDSYSWQMQSANSSGVPDGIYNSGVITNAGSSYTFPTTGLPCGHKYLITLTVAKICPQPLSVSCTQTVQVNCGDIPVITASSISICTGGTVTLTSNYVNSPTHNIINWSTGGTSLGSAQTITVNPTTNTTYDLTATYVPTGCGNTTSVLVTVQNIQPNFYLSDGTGTGGATSPFYTIEVSNPTTSSDPSFGYWWGVKEVTGTGPYTTVANTEVDNPTSGCWWTGTSPHWFGGYQATTSPQYTSGTNPSLTCNAFFGSAPYIGQPSQGYFLKGHQYQVTYATWSNTCLWNPISTVAYVCPGCKEVQGTQNTFFTPDITFEEAMGIKNLDNQPLTQTKVEIYPNPNNGNFIIETQSTTPQVVEMFDLTGRLVLSQSITGKANINVSDLTNGIYNIKISGNNTVTNKRVIISK